MDAIPGQVPAAPPMPQGRVSSFKRQDRLNCVMLMGTDQLFGANCHVYQETLTQGVDRIVVSVAIARLGFRGELDDQLDLPRLFSAIPEGKREKAIAEFERVKREYLANRKALFENYDVQLHKSRTFLVLTRKGSKFLSGKELPLLPKSSFSPLRQSKELIGLKVPLREPESAELAEAFPDLHKDMTLLMVGHGEQERGVPQLVAGLPPRIFQTFLETLGKRDHRDLVVVRSCFIGGKAKNLLPEATKWGKANRSMYVITGLDDTGVTGVVGGDNLTQFFHRATQEMSATRGMLRHSREMLDPLGANILELNQAQVRFPGSEGFQPLTDSSRMFNLTSPRIAKHRLANEGGLLEVPSDVNGLDIHPARVPFPLRISTRRNERFFLVPRGAKAHLSKLVLSEGSTLRPFFGALRKMLTLSSDRSKEIAIDELSLEGGKTIRQVKIWMPSRTHSSLPGVPSFSGISFYDDQGNWFVINADTGEVSCFPKGNPDYFPEGDLGVAEGLVEEIPRSRKKANKKAALLAQQQKLAELFPEPAEQDRIPGERPLSVAFQSNKRSIPEQLLPSEPLDIAEE